MTELLVAESGSERGRQWTSWVGDKDSVILVVWLNYATNISRTPGSSLSSDDEVHP